MGVSFCVYIYSLDVPWIVININLPDYGHQTHILFQLKDPTPNAGSLLEATGIALHAADYGDYRYDFNGKENGLATDAQTRVLFKLVDHPECRKLIR